MSVLFNVATNITPFFFNNLLQDFKKKSTYDALSEDEVYGEKDVKKEKSFFQFDFQKPTESAFESAGNIIKNNLSAYNSFVEVKLGIPSGAQNVFRIGSAITTGSLMPFALPFIAGGALRNRQNNRIQNITNQDTQGTINTVVSPRIMNIQPTAQDIARGGGSGESARSTPSTTTNKSYSAPQQTSGPGGLHSGY